MITKGETLYRLRRAYRWQRSKRRRTKVPPRHIAQALGWKYVVSRRGEILHVPGDA